MRNRKILFGIIISIILILLIFNVFKVKSNKNLLIISTPNNDNKIINYYTYDIISKNIKKIYSTNKTCYPTAVLSDDGKVLYFTKNDVNQYAQLFQRNLITNEEKQLTTEKDNKIINVDFMKINYKNQLIYLRTVQKDHRNFSLSIYNIKTNELRILDKSEQDLSNQFFDFANSSDSMLVLQNSEEEKFKALDEANKTHNLNLYFSNKIILKDAEGYNKKNYGIIKNEIVDVSMSPNSQAAIILTGEVVNLDEHKFKKQVLLINLNNDSKVESILSTGECYKDIMKICFATDGKGFYFVASDTNIPCGVYYYNLKSKATSLVLKIDNEKIIDCIETHK
ncbi:hypothetical protein CSC2_28050 [Clostridium zeae]|uniref:Protein TolB n=1 Tax=Clostridium zeae TaxID=2759022 RepID=A0ABQ1EC84_9CLOT|nr:hypothetical protein [Clostridium zeae]GFZ32279.1 hypothetical protein CSC2_28050 [Clostridium zeae]